MSRTTRHVLRAELLRGTAPVAAATFAVGGPAMLFNDTEDWAGRWAPLAEYIRVLLIVLVPLAVAAGAWQVGRERRRRSGELVSSASRPSWQPVVLAWTAVTLGIWAGLPITWLSGAVLVAPVATYPGRGWWWTLAVAFVAVAAGTALGVAVGRMVPGRLVAPLAGVATYVAIGVLTTWPVGGSWLLPNLSSASHGTSYLRADFQLLQGVWLGALSAALLVVAAARRKWLALLPAALAAAAAIPVATAGEDERRAPDPQASELVCAEGTPEVCLTRVNSFLLDEVTPPARAQLARWADVGGGFTRVVDQDALEYSWPPAEGTVPLYLHNLIAWDGGLLRETEYGDSTIDTVLAHATHEAAWRNCDFEAEPDQSWEVMNAAYAWASGDELASPLAPGLLALPVADQRDWMGRYLEAARSCDDGAFAELAEELR